MKTNCNRDQIININDKQYQYVMDANLKDTNRQLTNNFPQYFEQSPITSRKSKIQPDNAKLVCYIQI